jgi:sulfatase modifying factor 1
MSAIFSHRSRIFLVASLFLVPIFGLFAQSAPEPRRFAILVGINQYSDPGLLSLQKAQNDAEDLGKALSRLGGFKAVTVMSGSLPYNDLNFPSKNKILDRVGTLADIVKPDDQVLFFFSGHGVNDKSGESYLLPIDAQIKDPTGTGIDLQNDIIAPLQSAGVKNIVCLVDACQKTVAKDKGIAIVGVNEFKAVSSAVVIMATGKGRASYEDPNGANGLFTRGILTALSGEADLNHDGLLSVTDLERYLPDAVAEYAFTVGISQKPSVYDRGNGSLQPALVRIGRVSQAAPAAAGSGASAAASTVSAAPTTAQSAKAQFVQFKVPEGVRVDLRLLTPDGREVKAWSDTSSLSEKLEPGNYRVEAQDRSYLYYPYSTTITVGGTKVAVALDLKPNFGSLALSCDPPDGVEVLLNGAKQGTLNGSALTVDRLKSGSYELVLSRELYDTKRQTIQIEDGKVAQVKLTLSPNFFTLSVSEKAGMAASLYVDGQNKGSLPQTIKIPFRDVSLRVVPADARYNEWSDTVQPSAKGSVEKRVAVLAGRTGTLEVTTDPDADAELTLTPSAGGAAQKIGTAPMDYDTLVGDYELVATATLNGKKLAASAKVTVREAQTSPLRLELKDAMPAVPSGMVLVPGGTFTMGSPAGEAGRSNDEVQHQVSLSSYYISATEVTQGQYKALMGTNPSGFKYKGDSLPVEKVSWYDAVAYCNKLCEKEDLSKVYTINGTTVTADWSAKGYRLPTEAEWEFAAKGGAASSPLAVNAVYAGSANVGDVAWYSSNSGNETHPVGTKAPNALGLYDMSGNVWEWCWDCYMNYPSGSQSDPAGPSSGLYRVLRGGSWDDIDSSILRSAFRYRHYPEHRDYGLGFRVARRP